MLIWRISIGLTYHQIFCSHGIPWFSKLWGLASAIIETLTLLLDLKANTLECLMFDIIPDSCQIGSTESSNRALYQVFICVNTRISARVDLLHNPQANIHIRALTYRWPETQFFTDLFSTRDKIGRDKAAFNIMSCRTTGARYSQSTSLLSFQKKKWKKTTRIMTSTWMLQDKDLV